MRSSYCHRLCVNSFLILLFLLLGCSYSLVCEEFSDVVGYECGHVDYVLYIINCFMLLLCSMSIGVSDDRVSSGFLWIVFYFHVVPSVLFFSSTIHVSFAESLVFSSVVVVSYTIISLVSSVGFKAIPLIKHSSITGSILMALIWVSFCFVLIKEFGLNFNPPSIFDVYDVRAHYIEGVSRLGAYISILSGYFLAPLLIIIGAIHYARKHRLYGAALIASALFVSYLVYSSSGLKSVAFMPVVVALLFALMRSMRGFGVGFCINFMFLAIMMIAWILYFLGFEDLLLHWVRRSLIVPGMNVAYYYDFSSIGGFDDVASAPNAVSNYYYSTDGSANSGFIGDSIYRFGFAYLWVGFSAVFLMFKATDFVAGNNARYILPLFLPSAYALANSSFFTVLITYGFAPMLLLVYLNRRFFNND